MNIDFQEQIAFKTDNDLIHMYVNADDYQKEFIDAVFGELTKRKVPLEKYQKDKEQKSKSTKEQFEKGRKGN